MRYLLGYLLTFCFSANATSRFEPQNIDKIIIHNWGNVLIYFSAPLGDTENCANKQILVLKPANQFFDVKYASLLASYHAKRNVAGYAHGCDSEHNAPILVRLDLESF